MVKYENLQYINCKTAHIKVAVNYLRSMSHCLINQAAAVWSYMAVEGGESRRSHAPPHPPPPFTHLLLPPIQRHARTCCLSCIEHWDICFNLKYSSHHYIFTSMICIEHWVLQLKSKYSCYSYIITSMICI